MYKVAIIGLGKIGLTLDQNLDPKEYVYSHARAFHQHRAFELVAGVDESSANRAHFSRLYAKPAFKSVSECLAAECPDVIVLSVPTNLHLPVLKEILKHSRPKAILCEKPLSYRIKEAEEIVSICEAAGVAILVNFMRRAHPAVREIKQLIEDKKIAVPVKGTVWYSKGLLNNGSHFYDLLQYWLGGMRGFQVVQAARSVNDDAEPDVLVEFEHGKIYFLAANEEHYSHYSIELISPSGRLRYDLGGERVEWQPAEKSDTLEGYVKLTQDADNLSGSLSQIQLLLAEQLRAALAGEAANICTGRQALESMRDLSSIMEKSQ